MSHYTIWKEHILMANILHWVGVAFGLLVITAGVGFFLRGLTLKPGDSPTRVPGNVPGKKRHREL
jgi:hypothetical protein